MAYTGTKAQSGSQTTLSVGATPTLVGEITDLAQSGKMNKTDDATNLESPGEEFIATLLAPGSWTITLNRVPGDAGQALMLTDFNSKVIDSFTVQIAKTATQTVSGDKYAFSALVEEWNDVSSVKADKKITTQGKLKVSGSITFTAGT
jgi:hypothetical protein